MRVSLERGDRPVPAQVLAVSEREIPRTPERREAEPDGGDRQLRGSQRPLPLDHGRGPSRPAAVPGLLSLRMSSERTDAHGRTRAARLSVVAAAFLIAIKLATGLITGSLGLLAEAAHSATDLVAALLTLFAVRVAIRPADAEHHYGHGKAEHLAALGGERVSGARLGAHRCAVARPPDRLRQRTRRRHLVGDRGPRSWWRSTRARDRQRSRGAPLRLRRAGLERPALRLRSRRLGRRAARPGARRAAGEPKADAVAALFVAVLVMVAAVRLARQSIDVLMDRTSREAEEAVRAALAGLAGRVAPRARATRRRASTSSTS